MLISQLIERLENVLKEHGDGNVEVRNTAGEFDDVYTIRAVTVLFKPKDATVVYLQTEE